jgi:hypothetical protein
MKQHKTLTFCIGWALSLTLVMDTTALAATSLSNSLTGFPGQVSNAPATQAALGAVGIEFSSIDGLAPDFSSDPSVAFDASGATFGSLFAGDGGRNYMRTIESYAFNSFVAEVTVTQDTLATDQAFFGMGSGIIATWGTPDYAGRPSVFVTPENGFLASNAIDGLAGDWYGPVPPCPAGDWCKAAAPGFVETNAGTHRLRMTFDAATKEWVGSADIDYAGGAFVADVTTATYDLTLSFNDGVFIVNGWDETDPLADPSKIYFGGDDGAIFKDFSVTVAAAGVAGDYNGNGIVDAADYVMWRNGDSPDDTQAGYDLWRSRFGATSGSGSGLGAAGVPEPASLVLLLLGLMAYPAITGRRRVG